MATRSIEHIIERQMRQWDRVSATLGYQPGRPEETPEARPSQAAAAEQPVICVSRDLGSGTREVIEGLAQALGYEVFGRAIIDHIAEDLNVQRRLIDSLDERLRSNIEAVVDGFLRDRTVTDRDYFQSLVRVIQGVAKKGGVIILGRGGHLIVGDEAALRIRLTSPLEHRVRRLIQEDGLSEAEARERVLETDKRRRDFLRHFFHTRPDDASQFDLVLNTARIGPQECVRVIRTALGARGIEIASQPA